MADVPPVTPPTPPVTPPVTPPSTDWTASFDSDTKAYVTNKGFKDPSEVLNSYRQFEKLQGVPQDRLLKIPESVSSPEMKAVWEKLGMPKEAKDYGIEFPKEISTSDPELKAWAESIFLKNNFTKAQAEGFMKDYSERFVSTSAKAQENFKAAQTQADNNLKKEWGAAYDQNKNLADTAARNLGMSTEEVGRLGQAMGMDKAMKFLHGLGTKVGEHGFINGQPANNGILAPEQAKAKIEALMGDKGFLDRLTKGDKDARTQWDTIHAHAFPGEMTV